MDEFMGLDMNKKILKQFEQFHSSSDCSLHKMNSNEQQFK